MPKNDPEPQNTTHLLEKIVRLIDENAQIETIIETDQINLQIDTQPSGAFIGYHGESLQALQSIFSLILYKKNQDQFRLNLNVADYQQQRQNQLEVLADKAVNTVRRSQSSFTLPYLSSQDRRHVHLYLSNLTDIKTESVGEGDARRLVIFPS